MRATLCLFLLLSVAVCLSECGPRGGRGARAMKQARRAARRAVTRGWFGPVEEEQQCQDPAQFELREGEDRPSEECDEVRGLIRVSFFLLKNNPVFFSRLARTSACAWRPFDPSARGEWPPSGANGAAEAAVGGAPAAGGEPTGRASRRRMMS